MDGYGSAKVKNIQIGDISAVTDWRPILADVTAVVHLAAVAHNKNVLATDFEVINVNVTNKLIKACVEVGISKFVFLSSIGVLGPSGDVHFTNSSLPNPLEEYAKSKFKSEIDIKRQCENTQTNYTIIRTPVYGPGVPGNFRRLINLTKRSIPIPCDTNRIKKSFVGATNLSDFIYTCLKSKNSYNKTLLVSDDSDLSLFQIMDTMARQMGSRHLHVPISKNFCKNLLKLVGLDNQADKLFSSLTIDISHSKDLLGWEPPCDPKVDLVGATKYFMEN